MAIKLRRDLGVLGFLGLLALPGLAAATDSIEVGGDVGVGYSDNINRSPTTKLSEVIGTAGVQFAVLEKTRLLDLDMVGNLAYLDYLHKTYSSELVGNATGEALLRLVPEHLEWALVDTFTQTQVNLASPLTPANRENLNYFSTGPNVGVDLTDATSLRLQGRYSRVTYEVSPLSSNRYGGLLTLEHNLSSNARVSVNLGDDRIEPETASGVQSYDRQAAYLAYTLDGSLTKLDLSAGANRLHFPGSDLTGALASARISRKLGSLSTLSLEFGQQYTDQISSLVPTGVQLTMPTLNTQVFAVTANPYKTRYGNFAWDITGRRTSIRLSAGIDDENYNGQSTLDRKRYSGALTVTRSLTSRITARAALTYNDYRYALIADRFHELDGLIGADLKVSRLLSVSVSAEDYHRSAETVPPSATELRYFLRLHYGGDISRQPASLLGR